MNKYLFIILILSVLFGCKQNIIKSEESKTIKKDYSSFENGLNYNDSTNTGQSINERMEFYKVPGVSVAIFDDGKIIWQKGYGLLDTDTEKETNSNTKFQVASISKAVTSLGIIKLVEDHNLDIDKDINQYLKNWKIDYAKFSDTSKVTIRKLLSHTGGINLSGFKGYSKSEKIPTTVQVLNGQGNTAKIKLDTIAGTKFSYSGGGYTILQLLVENVTDLSFQEYFKNKVFEPLKMKNSTFNQFPYDNVSSAHDKAGISHKEDWLVYPELSAAGLWSTPSDLSIFCLAIENSYDYNGGFISNKNAREMLKPVIKWSAGEFGLGLMLKGTGQNLFYFHTGSNPGGFRSIMVDFYKRKTGIVILTNSDNGGALYNEILLSFMKLNNIEL